MASHRLKPTEIRLVKSRFSFFKSMSTARKGLIFFSLSVMLFLAGLYTAPFVQSYTQPSYYTFENAPYAADTYLIYKSGGVYYSRNTDSGVVSSDANCTTLVHTLRDAMDNGTIFFKPGIYTLNLVIDRKDITIKGDGHNSTYFRNDNANPVIDVQGLSGDSLRGITIEDVTVHGTGTSGIGIRATHCYHTLTLEGVRVQGMDSYGVYLENCYDALLQDCIIQSNSDWGVYADQCHAMGITDCYIIDNGDSTAGNIHLNHTAGSSIHGTTIENSKYGVKISDNAHGVTISNSFLEVNNEGSNLVWITGNSTAYPKNTVIENSFFEGKSGTWPDAYIYVDYATETKVEGNYLPVYPGMIGINITAQASYTKIEGNQFRSTGTFLTDLGTDTTIIQPQNQGFWWSGDNRTDLIVNPTSEASYIVETDGTDTWMTNCSTGQRDATGTDAGEIINWALGNFTGSAPQETVMLKGALSIDDELSIKSYTYVDATQAKITQTGNNHEIFRNADFEGGNTHITIHGGYLDGNKDSIVGQEIIYFKKVTDSVIEDVYAIDAETVSFSLDGGCNRTHIRYCTSKDSGTMGAFIGSYATATYTYDWKVTDCNFDGSGSHGIYLSAGAVDGIADRNHFVNIGAEGDRCIRLSGSDNTISNNVLHDSVHAIGIGDLESPWYQQGWNNTVVGNTIESMTNQSILVFGGGWTITANNLRLSGHHGIYLYGSNSTGHSISGNDVQDSMYAGICFYNGAGQSSVGLNSISNNGGDGILGWDAGTGCMNMTIVGNTIANNGEHGIDQNNNCDYWLIVGNSFISNTAGTTDLAGANNEEAHNLP